MEVRRRYQRVPFQAETVVKTPEDHWNCTLLNIALGGDLLESKSLDLEHGARCQITITLPASAIVLEFDAELAHREGQHYGFKFIHVDLQSLTHLRKLIELNTGDADSIRGELMAWLDES